MPLHRDRMHVRLPWSTLSVSVLRRGLRRFGGVRQAMRRALGLFRREGLEGIRRGVMALRAAARAEGADGRNDYEKWIALYDTLRDDERARFSSLMDAMAARPLVSVIMPVYDPQPRWLEAAIKSVCRQSYPHWELCIADDASTNPAIREVLLRHAEAEPRIKVTFREKNGHISACSNTALELAHGEWIVLLDHDDLLSEHALYWVVDAINSNPQAQLIYSDEDKVTESGIRCVPHFKPAWNYDLFLAYNYISHLGAYRRDLVENVGGFREGMEGAQDYDLALRCIERLAPSRIVHVPRVLYHWRMHRASTAVGGQSKPYATPAGQRVLDEHFSRRGIRAKAELQPAGYYRPRYELTECPRRASLVVFGVSDPNSIAPWRDRLATLTAYDDYEILIVLDARSEDDLSASFHDANQRIDHAVSEASGDFVVLIQYGLEPLSRDWLAELISHAARENVGVVAPRIVDIGERTIGAGAIFGIGGVVGRAHGDLPAGDPGYFHRAVLAQSMSAVTSGCMVMRKSRYQEAGGLASGSVLEEWAEVDLCLRMREAGYRSLYVGHVTLRDPKDSSTGRTKVRRRAEPLKETLSAAPRQVWLRWGPLLQDDPAYNPNLTLDYEDFSLAWPPRVPPLRYGSPTPTAPGERASIAERR